MASLPSFQSQPPIDDQPAARPSIIPLSADVAAARPPLITPASTDASNDLGGSPTSVRSSTVPMLSALNTSAKPTLTAADVDHKIKQSIEGRFGQSDEQGEETQRQADVDQLVINNIQDDLSGASTWNGPLRSDPWLR